MNIGTRLGWVRPATFALFCSLPALPALSQQETQRDTTARSTAEQQAAAQRERDRENQARTSQSRATTQERTQSQDQNRAAQERRQQEQEAFERTQRQSTDRSASSAGRADQQRDQYGRDQTGQRQQRDQYGRDQSSQGQQRDQYGRSDQQFSRDQSSRAAQVRLDQSSDQQARSGSFRQQLGIELGQQTQGQGGLSISNVQQGTAAARAGLRSGDIIASIDGRNITSSNQFYSYLSGQYGRRVPIVIWRGNRQYTIQLTPESHGDTAWLGVYLQDSEDNQGQSGARAMQVYPAGPAARAGLYTGDVVTAVDGQRIEGASDLISTIEEQRPGARIELTVTRNNQQVKLPVTLGSRDSFVYRDRGQSEDQWGGQSRQYTSSQSGEWSRDSNSESENDYFADLPPFAMQLEHERRSYEQHQRIETEITKLQEEVRQLREAIQNLRR